MAFFDSPKNKALWDRELENLDVERERRKTEGYKPDQVRSSKSPGEKGHRADNPKVRRITLNELIEIERLARASEKEGAGLQQGNTKDREVSRRSMPQAGQKSASL